MSEARFRIGDKVRIRQGAETDNDNYPLCRIKPFSGVGTVGRVSGGHIRVVTEERLFEPGGMEGWYLASDLVPAEDPKLVNVVYNGKEYTIAEKYLEEVKAKQLTVYQRGRVYDNGVNGPYLAVRGGDNLYLVALTGNSNSIGNIWGYAFVDDAVQGVQPEWEASGFVQIADSPEEYFRQRFAEKPCEF